MYIFFGFVSEVLISSLQTRPNNRKGYNKEPNIDTASILN